MNSMSIEFPSIIDNIRIVESFIDNAKLKLNFNDDIYGNIMVSVTESVNNAIVHGNNLDKNKK
ncbi:MAG: ATP-binding protein, partial [Cytophagales bacterium]